MFAKLRGYCKKILAHFGLEVRKLGSDSDEESLSQANEALEATRAENQRLKEHVERLEEAAKHHQESLSQLSQEMEGYVLGTQALEESLSQANEALEATRAENQRLEEQIFSLRQEHQEVTEQLAQARRALNEAEEKMKEAEEAYGEFRKAGLYFFEGWLDYRTRHAVTKFLRDFLRDVLGISPQEERDMTYRKRDSVVSFAKRVKALPRLRFRKSKDAPPQDSSN